MSASITIQRDWVVGGVATDPTSITLTDEAGAYGLKRADTGEVVVAAGQPFVKVSVGLYRLQADGLVEGATYLAATTVVYAGRTYRFVTSHTASGTTVVDETIPVVTGDEDTDGLLAIKKAFIRLQVQAAQNPNPSYSVNGQQFSLTEYQQFLVNSIAVLNRLLQAQDPYMLHSVATT